VRYFYKDPLEAAWMAKRFGMRFPKAKSGHYKPSTLAAHQNWKERGFQTQPDKYYIHPDSLHLMEPQVGDMISHFGLRAWRIDSMDDYAYFHPNMPNESIGRFTLKADKPTIIQRNGMAFMWPESEAT
jgi:hypothetical protein